MSKPGVLVYKCRRCGGLDKNTHVPNLVQVLAVVSALWPRSPECFGGIIAVVDVHSCPDGHMGVSDLTGGELETLAG